MKLNSEKEHLVLDNQGLVHYIVQKFGEISNPSEYDDLVSIGTIGLIRAAITFDSSKKFTFATYASKCIKNEIFQHYRKAKKYAKDISIYETIGNDEEGKEFTLEDSIEHPGSDFVEKIANKDVLIQLVSIVLNYLEGKKRLAILYRMGEVSMTDIAEKLNTHRRDISKTLKKATNQIRKVANDQVHYKEVFSMSIVGEKYRISFSSKDISNFNKIFATLLKNLTSAEKLPDFMVNCNGERIVVQIPAHPESFSFVAQIIQEIDDYSMIFVSDKSTLPTDNTVPQEVESDDKDERNGTMEQKNHESDTVEPYVVEKSNERHTSQSRRVREFILTLDRFSVKQVRSNFPDVPTAIVNNVIRFLKIEGLITCISRGKYVVNKT